MLAFEGVQTRFSNMEASRCQVPPSPFHPASVTTPKTMTIDPWGLCRLS